MATETPPTPATPAAALPDFLRAAKPNPITNRAPWYKNTAPTYAGIFLWFVFWDSMSANGLDLAGLGLTLLAIVVAGFICHYLFYLVPGLLGMKTGLPLYVVGTSTFGAVGGLLLPGFLMGLLQFGWLAVNTYFSSKALAQGHDDTPLFMVLCVVWAALAAFVGLKGIQYVAKVATYLPLIPLIVLILALVRFGRGAADYWYPVAGYHLPDLLKGFLLMVAAIVGFFATAGAAGVDFGMNSRDKRDVNLGGIWGILFAIVLTAGVAAAGVGGATASKALPNRDVDDQVYDSLKKAGKSEQEINAEIHKADFTLTNGLKSEVPDYYNLIMIGLTIAAFPGACFSSFIAANSFKTVMPRVNSFLSVGVGALVSILLAVTRLAADLPSVFGIIGASFGPICGAMFVDYFLAGRKWAGPRAGFNPAGWGAWLVGFLVGILPNLHLLNANIPDIPAAPVVAFVVGAVVYFILAKIGLQSAVIPYGPAQQQQA